MPTAAVVNGGGRRLRRCRLHAGATRERDWHPCVALGADRAKCLGALVMSQNLWPTLIGIWAIGVAAAAMATRLVASMIYGVTPLDPATFVGTAVVLVGVAMCC